MSDWDDSTRLWRQSIADILGDVQQTVKETNIKVSTILEVRIPLLDTEVALLKSAVNDNKDKIKDIEIHLDKIDSDKQKKSLLFFQSNLDIRSMVIGGVIMLVASYLIDKLFMLF